jgi:hypothetical protein
MLLSVGASVVSCSPATLNQDACWQHTSTVRTACHKPMMGKQSNSQRMCKQLLVAASATALDFELKHKPANVTKRYRPRDPSCSMPVQLHRHRRPRLTRASWARRCSLPGLTPPAIATLHVQPGCCCSSCRGCCSNSG